MEKLTSLKNPRISLWRSLKERKARKDSGLFLVEGIKMCREALNSGLTVEALLLEENLQTPFTVPREVPVYLLPPHVLAAVCDTKTPQGMAAVLRMRSQPLKGTRLVALDGVQDPGNVGTILRTADCAGFDGVLLSAQCADPCSPKVLRATMGSFFRVPTETVEDLPAALKALQGQGFRVLSTQLDGNPFYERKPAGTRFCLVIGNEGNGVSEAVKRLADERLRLPMRGGAESLNAAVAAAVMMYDLTRDLPENGKETGCES